MSRAARMAMCAATFCAIQAVAAGACIAQSQRAVPSEISGYFTGHWRCTGAFANGRPTAGEIAFRPILHGAWLSMTQDDKPPGAYHAFSLWGPTRDSGVVAYIADVTGSMRQFIARAPYRDSIVLTRHAADGDTPTTAAERFIYARRGASRFLVTWETSRDSGRTWQMGDTLSCVKH